MCAAGRSDGGQGQKIRLDQQTGTSSVALDEKLYVINKSISNVE